LSTQFFDALQQLGFFAILMRHGLISSLDNTHPGYGINQVGV
jgi:hypothetical protein